MNFKSLICLFCIITSNALLTSVYSQGCSDAGLCTTGGMKHENGSENGGTFTLNNQFGKGEQSVNIYSVQLEYRHVIKDKYAFQVKLPWIFANGDLGNNNGIGDITLAGTFQNLVNKDWKLNATVGFKFPTGKTNDDYQTSIARFNPYSLPMPYQTGLGTFDLLLGADIRNEKGWLFAAGLQIPLIQNNRNRFDTGAVAYVSKAAPYFTSSNLNRRPDLVARIERQFKLNEKTRFQIGFVPIYHLGVDRYTPVFGSTEELELEGSDGLTLNLGGGFQYLASEHLSLNIKYASPLLVRKVRPDGLTRAFVVGLEIAYKL